MGVLELEVVYTGRYSIYFKTLNIKYLFSKTSLCYTEAIKRFFSLHKDEYDA